MKKIYLSAIFLGMIASANAQETTKANAPYTMQLSNIETALNQQSPSQHFGEKAIGVQIWNDNFDDATNWTLDLSGQSSPFGWNIGTTINSWHSSTDGGINSTSGGGFAELYNGDYGASDQAINVTYTMTSVALDIPNLPGNTNNTDLVSLQFEQFGALFNDDQKVFVSTNGTDWTEVFTNNDRTTYVGDNPSAIYGNPEMINISLSPVIAGDASSVQIRFEWTSRFSGQSDLSAWTTFGWFIDDVKIVTNPDNDIELTSSWHGDIVNDWEYSMIPLTQARPMVTGVIVKNNGTATQTYDVTCEISDANGVVNTTPLSHTNAPGDIDTLWFNTGYTPSAVGDYTVKFSVPADDINSNNTSDAAPLNVNASIMAHDYDNAINGTYGFSSTTDNGKSVHSRGNIYSPTVDQDIYGVDVAFATGTTADLYFVIKVSQMQSGGSIQDPLNTISETDHTVTASEIGVVTTIVLPSAVTLLAGENYIIEVRKADATTGSEQFYIAGSASYSEDDDNSTIGYGPFGQGQAVNYYSGWNYAPYVRANFDVTLAIDENVLEGVSIFPNPSEGIVTVSNDNNTTNSIEVFNLVGGKVYSTTTSTSTKIDLSANGTGVYIVKVYNENGSFVERVVIK